MIIHRLIARHLKHRDDAEFYVLQAQDALRWIERQGVAVGPGLRVLDLGCGHGQFGGQFVARGCEVTFGDAVNILHDEFRSQRFVEVNLDTDDYAKLGQQDLVICSNVLEHLAKPRQFLEQAATLLRPGGHLYLSWTNWLSPWGGHDFSPFHYLGARRGVRLWSRLTGRTSDHTVFVNLFPTYIGQVLGWVRELPDLEVRRVAPRYYPEFAFLMKLPLLREFLAWNCALLLVRR
ncbi:MAG TPA: methyltransferase type 12 [Verrucomicrobiales bacterium]|nr:methyltransferase type 12 [Verrucomicrobiales bacterium]